MISAETILALEAVAKKQGSGIDHETLNGVWTLQNTWTEAGVRPTPGTDFLLRGLGARLELNNSTNGWRIVNQIMAAGVQLRFEGEAQLKGRRPMLMFRFETVKLSLSGRILLKRNLPEPSTRRMPFFALIAMADNGEWLAARGRGGGLALWMRGKQPVGEVQDQARS